jgi:hypothetical protein
VGAVTVIVPVGVVQVGCDVTEAVGGAGGAGTGSTARAVGDDIHPVVVLRTVTL